MRTYYNQKRQCWVIEHKISVDVSLDVLKNLTKEEQKQTLLKIEQKLKQHCDEFGGDV